MKAKKKKKSKKDYYALRETYDLITADLEVEEILQKTVDKLVKSLQYHSSVIFINEPNQNRVYSKVFTDSRINRLATKLINKPFNKLFVSYKERENLIVKAVLNKQVYQADELWKFTSPAISRKLSNILQMITNTGFMIVLPLIYKEKCLGAIMLTKHERSNFDDDLDLLKQYSNQLSISLYNAQQKEFLKRSNRNLYSVFELTNTLFQTQNVHEVAQKAMDALPQKEFLIGGTLALYDQNRKMLAADAITQNKASRKIAQIIGNHKKHKIDLSDPKNSKSIHLQTIKSKTPNYTDDVAQVLSPPIKRSLLFPMLKILNAKSAAVHPIIIEGESIGTISYFVKDLTAKNLSESRKKLLETYTKQISIALSNAISFEQKNKALKQIKETLRKEQDMLDILAHELRTPLAVATNSLSISSEEAASKKPDVKKIKQFVPMADEEINKMAIILNRIFSTTRMDKEKYEISMEKVDLIKIVETVVNNLRNSAEEKNLKLKFKNGKEAFVYTDKVSIDQIVRNIVENAIKYTAKGSVTVGIEPGATVTKLIVKDTGVGISKEDIQNLGKKFYRCNNYIGSGDTVRPGGVGLGLYVVKNFLKVLEGKLQIKSVLGKGSEFTISIPTYNDQKSSNSAKHNLTFDAK